MHFFHHSYFWVNYLVDIAILVGAIFGGVKGTLAFQARRAKKKDAEEQAIIDTRVQSAVDVSVRRILTKVDDKVNKSVADQIKDVTDQIKDVAVRVEEVHAETHNNGGKSMKDSVNRMEESVGQLLIGQKLQSLVLEGQREKIEDIADRQEKSADAIGEIQIAVAAHIGAHIGLPEKGDRGDTGARGDRGARGAPGDHGHKGDTGETGAEGHRGDVGETGARGESA